MDKPPRAVVSNEQKAPTCHRQTSNRLRSIEDKRNKAGITVHLNLKIAGF
jgi:hypothetical protein